MRKTTWTWVSPLALLAALALAGCGGGGGGGGGGGTMPPVANPFALTTTPGHGDSFLNWTGAPVGTTSYTIQRAAAAGGPFFSLPTQGGGAVFTTAGTTYTDASYPSGTSNGSVTFNDPNPGTTYFYRIVASPGGATTNPTSATAQGPSAAQSTSIPPPSANPNKAAAPFNLSDSGTHFTYTVSAANPANAKVTMSIVLDYNVSVTDLRNITVNITGGTPDANGFTGDQIISEATLAANGTVPATGGISINATNPREIDIDTSKAGLNLPVAPSYSLVSINAYVATTHGGSSYVPVGIGSQIQGVGVDVSGTLPVSSEPYANQFAFDLKNQTTGT